MRNRALVFAASRAIGSLIQALQTILFARAVDVATFGAANIVLFTGYLTLGVADFGSSGLLSRATALKEFAQVRAALRFVGLSSGAVGAVLALAVQVTTGNSVYLLLVLGLAIERWIETSLSIVLALGDSTASATSVILRRAVSLIAYLVLVALSFDPLDAFSAAYLISSLAGLVQMAGYLHRRIDDDESAHSMRTIPRQSFPYLLVNVAGLSRLALAPLVGSLLGAAGAGAFSAANRLINPFIMMTNSAASVVLPESVHMPGGQAMALTRRIRLVCYVLTVVALLGSPLASQLLKIVFGPRYGDAGVPFAILLAALFPAAGVALTSAIVQGQGHALYMGRVGILFAVLMLTGVVAGTAVAGVDGAASGILVISLANLTALSRWPRTDKRPINHGPDGSLEGEG